MGGNLTKGSIDRAKPEAINEVKHALTSWSTACSRTVDNGFSKRTVRGWRTSRRFSRRTGSRTCLAPFLLRSFLILPIRDGWHGLGG